MQNPVVKAGCTFLSEQMNISNRVKLTPEGNNEVKIETTHKG